MSASCVIKIGKICKQICKEIIDRKSLNERKNCYKNTTLLSVSN